MCPVQSRPAAMLARPGHQAGYWTTVSTDKRMRGLDSTRGRAAKAHTLTLLAFLSSAFGMQDHSKRAKSVERARAACLPPLPSRRAERVHPLLLSLPVLAAGRHAQTGHVATVFGCTGFLGRYLVHKLAKQGTQVVVPYRDQDEMRHLKVTGDIGQIVPLVRASCSPSLQHDPLLLA